MVWKKIPGDCNLENSEGICKEANRYNKIVEWKENKQSLMTFLGEGNGNPLQCSCLENPRDRGAWWAAVYGVAQSWTRLK